MNIQEAYKLLEIPESISDEELKSVYKKLARKYHPDIYKEDPNKLKFINEAYQFIIDHRANPPRQQQGFDFSNLGDLFGFGQQRQAQSFVTHIDLPITISFHEAVLGCSKEINYKRNKKCPDCSGAGFKSEPNGCKACDGFGRISSANRGMVMQSTCSQCYAKGIKRNKCAPCEGKSVVTEERKGNIHIPPGHTNLCLAGQGHFVGNNFFGSTNTDVLITVSIQPYKDFSIIGQDVHSSLDLSLLEVLEGCEKEIETIHGNKKIKINSKSKNSEKIKIQECGLKNTNGQHIVKLKVSYPEDISSLVSQLKNVENITPSN